MDQYLRNNLALIQSHLDPQSWKTYGECVTEVLNASSFHGCVDANMIIRRVIDDDSLVVTLHNEIVEFTRSPDGGNLQYASAPPIQNEEELQKLPFLGLTAKDTADPHDTTRRRRHTVLKYLSQGAFWTKKTVIEAGPSTEDLAKVDTSMEELKKVDSAMNP